MGYAPFFAPAVAVVALLSFLVVPLLPLAVLLASVVAVTAALATVAAKVAAAGARAAAARWSGTTLPRHRTVWRGRAANRAHELLAPAARRMRG
jgi:hypothetical protein